MLLRLLRLYIQYTTKADSFTDTIYNFNVLKSLTNSRQSLIIILFSIKQENISIMLKINVDILLDIYAYNFHYYLYFLYNTYIPFSINSISVNCQFMRAPSEAGNDNETFHCVCKPSLTCHSYHTPVWCSTSFIYKNICQTNANNIAMTTKRKNHRNNIEIVLFDLKEKGKQPENNTETF